MIIKSHVTTLPDIFIVIVLLNTDFGFFWRMWFLFVRLFRSSSMMGCSVLCRFGVWRVGEVGDIGGGVGFHEEHISLLTNSASPRRLKPAVRKEKMNLFSSETPYINHVYYRNIVASGKLSARWLWASLRIHHFIRITIEDTVMDAMNNLFMIRLDTTGAKQFAEPNDFGKFMSKSCF